MKVSFDKVQVGATYSRQQLAEVWGYSGYEALARGLVTPRGDNKLILFITEGYQQQQTPQKYSNHFDGHTLQMEGPSDHFAEERMLKASEVGDEIHFFHRTSPQDDFTYRGLIQLVSSQINATRPSQFTLELI